MLWLGVDAEFCSMSLRIMHDSDDSGGKLNKNLC